MVGALLYMTLPKLCDLLKELVVVIFHTKGENVVVSCS